MPQIGEVRRGVELGYKGNNKHIWSACVDCGKERWVTVGGIRIGRVIPQFQRCLVCAQRINASRKMGDRNPNWAGGRIKTSRGYIRIKVYPDDFFFPMADKEGYVLEHRLVVAQHLGRNLHLWEIVHHKGVRSKGIENRADNLRDNLQLVSDDRHKQISILERNILRLEAKIEKQTTIIKELRAHQAITDHILYKRGGK